MPFMCMHTMLYVPVDISAALTTNRLQLATVFYMQPVAFDKHVNLLYISLQVGHLAFANF